MIFAVFSDIYHGILRTPFINKTASDYSFLCQKNGVYAIIIASICFENWFKTCSKISDTIVNIPISAKNNFSL